MSTMATVAGRRYPHLAPGQHRRRLSYAGSAQRIQIVNDDKKFTENLSEQIDVWGLRDAGFTYNIVAVFGSQSTGKSTLLNRLFGTSFDVMDETKRQQTTKGIWMCRGEDMNIMVMDVEGTDGRERGEDQDFERKSALFSMASSEVLIVNIWEHQIGLYQGANMGLLKTVFEVNLSIFAKGGATDQRTLLLFVIRDHIGTTPLVNLANTLEQDLIRIWDSLSKPPGLENCKLSDFFDLSFTGLPHKILVPEKFDAEVAQLRKRFVQKEHPDYIFKPAYHKRIPADGVALYMENIWEQVQNNKDLDLPTQQELLAQFRCDEISAAALNEFNEEAKPQKKPIESGRVVEGLGSMMRNWRGRALERYDSEASRYHKAVYKRKRGDLIATIDATLSPLFLGQLKNLHKAFLADFKRTVLEGLKGEDYSFEEVVGRARSKCESSFVEGAKEAVVEEGSQEWSWDEELGLLREEIRAVADQCRKDETKKMINAIERNFKKQISEPIELHLSKAQPDMWDRILTIFRETIGKAETTYLAKAKSFDCTEEENVAALGMLRRRAWLVLRSKVDEQTADNAILAKLRGHFEERFRYDDAGVPRVWRPDDDIDGTYKRAKEQTLELIPLYSHIRPRNPSLAYTLPSEPSDALLSTDEFDFPSTLTVFSEMRALDLGTRFRREADAYYVEAKRSTVSSVAQIPYWMYGVLVVLGWNEAMVVIFNPLYCAALLVTLVFGFMVLRLGLVGPLFQISRTVGGEVNRQVQNRLREHFSQPALTQPVRTRPIEKAFDDDEMEERIRRRKLQSL